MQISALVLEIFKYEKCVKYANEMTDDIHSTKYYIKYRYINKAILVNLQQKPLKLGRLLVIIISVPMATHSFPVPSTLISIF